MLHVSNDNSKNSDDEEENENDVTNDHVGHESNINQKRKRTSVAKPPSEVIKQNLFSDSEKSSESSESDDEIIRNSNKKRKKPKRILDTSDEESGSE